VVPLYMDDRPENTAYILNDAGVRLLYLRGAEQWERLLRVRDQLDTLARIVTQGPVEIPDGETRVRSLADWLPDDLNSIQTRFI
jgi:long-chain acyl-CoA synthetase